MGVNFRFGGKKYKAFRSDQFHTWPGNPGNYSVVIEREEDGMLATCVAEWDPTQKVEEGFAGDARWRFGFDSVSDRVVAWRNWH